VPHEHALDLQKPRENAQPHASAALAFEQRQPGFEAVHVVAHLVDAADEFVGFGAARGIASFFL
jgi:hypothetical protein